MPGLPPEIWEYILGFIPRYELRQGACTEVGELDALTAYNRILAAKPPLSTPSYEALDMLAVQTETELLLRSRAPLTALDASITD